MKVWSKVQNNLQFTKFPNIFFKTVSFLYTIELATFNKFLENLWITDELRNVYLAHETLK